MKKQTETSAIQCTTADHKILETINDAGVNKSVSAKVSLLNRPRVKINVYHVREKKGKMVDGKTQR